jgi:hypothetical protein
MLCCCLHQHLKVFRSSVTATVYRNILPFLVTPIHNFQLSHVKIKVCFTAVIRTQFFIVHKASLQLFNNAYSEKDICGSKYFHLFCPK